MSASPGVSEFASDAFDSTGIDQEDLRKEMEQLVLDKKDSVPSPEGQLLILQLDALFGLWKTRFLCSLTASRSK